MRPAGGGESEAGDGENGAAAVTPAVYSTTLAFLDFERPPEHLFLRLQNRTSAETLELQYRGWLGTGEVWRPVLDIRESAGVPRAAWRVLPVGPLRLSVTDDEQLAGLSLQRAEGRIGLRVGEGLAEWVSVTGQREGLRRAVLERDSVDHAGILLTSQTARVAEAASRGGEWATLLSDTLGNALVILRSGTGADAPVVVHTLIDGRSRRWDGAELTPADTSAGDAPVEPASPAHAAALDSLMAGAAGDGAFERYVLAIPGAGMEGMVAVRRLDSAAVTESGASLPAAFASVTVAVSGTLSMSGFRLVLDGGSQAAGVP